MLKPIKLNVPDHNVFMVNDLHWGHNRPHIYARRGFESIEAHDAAIVHRWNEVVRPDSHAFHLGDFVFSDPTGERFMTLVQRLTFGVLWCLLGNHNSGTKRVYIDQLAARFPDAVKDGQIQYEVYPLEMLVDGNPNKRVVFLPEYVEAYVGKQAFALCHYPIYSHNGISKDAVHCCGHSHGGCPLTNKDTGRGKRLDLGWESFGKPISVAEIKRHLAGRDLDPVDHHGADSGE